MRAFLCAAMLLPLAVSADYMDHFVVREDVGPHKAPSLGEAHLLVMPVEVAGYPPIDIAALEDFFGEKNPNGFVHYYETASLGRYKPRVTVGPKIVFDKCPLPEAQFPKCKVARGDINVFTPGLKMMRDVVRMSHEQGVDFTKLDVNGRKGTPDGWVDGVMLLTNVSFGGIAFPFAYFNRDDNLNGGTGGPLIVDGIKIGHIAIAGETDTLTMVHEFGHVLGLTDLYDQSGTYDGLYLSQMGAWLYDPNIPLPDAESRFRLRWANWHQVQGKEHVIIPPVETSGAVYRLGVGDEYFLVENRGPGEFDKSLKTRGLAVFHVDRTIKLKGDEGQFVSRILDGVNDDPYKPYIGLLQADGKFEVEHGKEFVEADDLFRNGSKLVPDSAMTAISKDYEVLSSNFHSGANSGITIQDITVRADGKIEATLIAPAADQCGDRLCADGEACAPVACGQSDEDKTAGCNATGPGWQTVGLLVVLAGRRRR